MSDLKTIESFVSDFYFLIISGIVAGALYLIRKYIKLSIISIIETLFKIKIYKDQGMDENAIHQAARIQDILAELRIHANCDRAYILQFHNGSVFTAKNQMWKVSCTNESVGQVRPRIAEMQNILSSAISDILYPYWSQDNSSFPGIVKFTKADCPSCVNNVCISGVFFHDVDHLQAGFSKGSLSAGNVKYALRTAILDDNQNKIGILCLDYCWQDAKPDEIKKMHEHLCKTAMMISYELRKKSKS